MNGERGDEGHRRSSFPALPAALREERHAADQLRRRMALAQCTLGGLADRGERFGRGDRQRFSVREPLAGIHRTRRAALRRTARKRPSQSVDRLDDRPVFLSLRSVDEPKTLVASAEGHRTFSLLWREPERAECLRKLEGLGGWSAGPPARIAISPEKRRKKPGTNAGDIRGGLNLVGAMRARRGPVPRFGWLLGSREHPAIRSDVPEAESAQTLEWEVYEDRNTLIRHPWTDVVEGEGAFIALPRGGGNRHAQWATPGCPGQTGQVSRAALSTANTNPRTGNAGGAPKLSSGLQGTFTTRRSSAFSGRLSEPVARPVT